MLSLRFLSSLALLLCLLISPCASHSHEKFKRTATSVRSSTHSSSVLKPVSTTVSIVQPSATTVTKTTTISVYPSTLKSTLHSSPASTTTVHLTTTILVTIKPITTTRPSLTAKANVAVYYGQGSGQQRLLHFCEQSGIDIIPLAFVNIFPSEGNGWPGTNFGNQCGAGVYSGPGYHGIVQHANDHLLSNCPNLAADIPVCQATYGKKIILSLGGGLGDYQVLGAADGIAFADFLWGAFGPYNSTWIAQNLPRPFDGPGKKTVEVDGFDFDIEVRPSDSSIGYIAMLNRLRAHFINTTKKYILTGAPQCIVPDANMGAMIKAVKFDALFVQFYNTPECSARKFIDTGSGFTYDALGAFLAGTPSANASLYLGLPASPAGAGSYSASESYWLNSTELSWLIFIFSCRINFGGIMLWEATLADGEINAGLPYYQTVKQILLQQNPVSTCQPVANNPSVTRSGPLQTIISTDGSCGPGNGKICPSSAGCCSQYGYCGSSSLYCAAGCQAAYGICNAANNPSSKKTSSATSTHSALLAVSSNGVCGPGVTCEGSSFGQCCSQYGYCGFDDSTGAYCGAFCQPAYGICSGTSINGACGSLVDRSCQRSAFGNCCSQYNYCGTTSEYCGFGCQSAWGSCD